MRRGCDRGEKKVKNGFYLQRAANNYAVRGLRAPARADGLFCGPLRASVRASRLPAGCQRMTRGGRRMLCRAMADGLRWAGGQMACREPTDAAQGSEDGTQRDGGCCVGGRQMLRRTTADGLQGAARCCAVCCMVCGASAGGAQRVEGWCAGSKRVVHGGPASCQQEALGGYIWPARVIAHFGKRPIHQVKWVCCP